METFADIIGLWASAEEFASDVGVAGGTARAWKARNSIPPEYWIRVVEAAVARGFRLVTLDTLARLAAERAA